MGTFSTRGATRIRCAAYAALLALTACTTQPLRQVTVDIWTDLPPTQMNAYELRVSRGPPGSEVVRFDQCFARTSDPTACADAGNDTDAAITVGDPLANAAHVTYAIVDSDSGDDSPLTVSVLGLVDGQTVVQNAAVLSFTTGAVVLPMPLLAACDGVVCVTPGWVCDASQRCPNDTPGCSCHDPSQSVTALVALDATSPSATGCLATCEVVGAMECVDPDTMATCMEVSGCLQWQVQSCVGAGCANDACSPACAGTCNASGACQPGCGENACTCANDCGSLCGDGCCSGPETCANCPGDCSCTCVSNGCGSGNDACTCSASLCASACGDGCCNGTDTVCNCPGDGCTAYCGDGCCDGTETVCDCADCAPTGSTIFDSTGLGDATDATWQSAHGGLDWHAEFAQTFRVPAGGFQITGVTVSISGPNRPPIDVVLYDTHWIELARSSLPAMPTTDYVDRPYSVSLDAPRVTSGAVTVELISTDLNAGNADFHVSFSAFDTASCIPLQAYVQGVAYWDTTMTVELGGTF